MSRFDTFGRLLVAVGGAAVGVVAGYVVFVRVPGGDLARLLGVVLVLLAVAAALRLAGRVADALFPDYTVAEVAVEWPITRDGGQPSVPTGPATPGADDVVDLVERADEDDAVEALVVKLNTPGGEPVASDDIRRAVSAFDGPTVAYTTDVCASGGYLIAAGCDELWAREGSLVGSIGVRGSRITAAGLLDKLGLEYEQFAAGAYKEAGSPLTDLDEDEREYLQGLVDGYYEQFVAAVSEGRGLAAERVRETEARVYLGAEAVEAGLVDDLGTREDVEDRLEADIGEVAIREFTPDRGLAERFRGGAREVAAALGAGIAGRVDDAEVDLRF